MKVYSRCYARFKCFSLNTTYLNSFKVMLPILCHLVHPTWCTYLETHRLMSILCCVSKSMNLKFSLKFPFVVLTISCQILEPSVILSVPIYFSQTNISLFSGSITQVGSPVGSAMNLIPEDGLPPILISTGVKGGMQTQMFKQGQLYMQNVAFQLRE